MSTPNIVINELLCFVSNRIDLLEITILKKLCLETYTSEEVLASKDLLFLQCTDKHVTLDNLIRKRIGTDRDARNLEDIFMMFQKLGKDQCPTFVAADINRLPPIYLEHTDVCTLLKKLNTLERDMREMKTFQSIQTEEIKKITAKQLPQPAPYASVAKQRSSSTQIARELPQRMVSEGVTQLRASTVQMANGSDRNESEEVHSDSQNEGQWVLKQSKKQKDERRRSQAAIPPQHPNVQNTIRRQRTMVTGTSEGSDLKGVEDRTVKIFSRRWPMHVTKDTVTTYIKSNFVFQGKQKFEVFDCRTNASTYKCFLIIGTCSDPKVFHDASKWPQGVQVSRYFEPRNPRQNSETSNDRSNANGLKSGTLNG